MNTVLKVGLLTFSFFVLGFGYALGKQPILSNPPSICEKHEVEAEEPSGALVVTTNNNESFDCGFSNSDSSLNEECCPFLTIKPNYPLDSSSYIKVLNYLNQLLPVYRQVDDLDIDMIEVL